jgi:hypothetical protein
MEVGAQYSIHWGGGVEFVARRGEKGEEVEEEMVRKRREEEEREKNEMADVH